MTTTDLTILAILAALAGGAAYGLYGWSAPGDVSVEEAAEMVDPDGGWIRGDIDMNGLVVAGYSSLSVGVGRLCEPVRDIDLTGAGDTQWLWETYQRVARCWFAPVRKLKCPCSPELGEDD